MKNGLPEYDTSSTLTRKDGNRPSFRNSVVQNPQEE